jgi:hypothetical protein
MQVSVEPINTRTTDSCSPETTRIFWRLLLLKRRAGVNTANGSGSDLEPRSHSIMLSIYYLPWDRNNSPSHILPSNIVCLPSQDCWKICICTRCPQEDTKISHAVVLAILTTSCQSIGFRRSETNTYMSINPTMVTTA